MKKEYRKPMLVVESFQLDAAIAGGACSDGGKMPINFSVDGCDLEDEVPGLGWFAQKCLVNMDEEDLCYQAQSFSDQFLTS